MWNPSSSRLVPSEAWPYFEQGGHMDEGEAFKQGNFVDFLETFKIAAREKRFIVRDFKKVEKVVDSKAELAESELQVAEKQAGMERWCKTHFGEAFCAWIHLKVIRAFVESVLRYGLAPVEGQGHEQQSNFILSALKLNKNKGIALKNALDKLLDVDSAAAIDDGEEGEYHPYCKLEFVVN
jgi:V-type H+-transporting ATPase subunit C